MKALTHIIVTHVVMLALFAGAALVFAQGVNETTIEEKPPTEEVVTNTEEDGGAEDDNSLTPAERRAQLEANTAEKRENIQKKKDSMEAGIAERKENTEAKRAEFQEKSEERKAVVAERRAQLQERAQERITNLAANMSNRMEAVIERIQNIIDRVSSRVEKIAERGVDTTESEAALASAQVSIDAALALISTIDDDVSDAVGSEDAKAGWVSVKENYTAIRDHLKTAHSELRASIEALKVAVADYKESNRVSDAMGSES